MRQTLLRRMIAPLAFVLAALFMAAPAAADPPDRFEPAVVNATLGAGESTTVDKLLHLTGLPARADITIAIDTTGSMGAALAQAKLDAIDICTDVQAAIPGARFAAVEFQDYPIAPYGGAGDSPYELHTPGYTADCATFSAGVGSMTLGFGGDGPEANNRVHFEAYSDPVLLASRDPAATRFLVVLADNVPHSVASFGSCPSTAPLSDPGRNGINESGGGDDIETPDAINGLVADDHILLYIDYGGFALPCYEDLTAPTGGDAVPASAADDIGAFIVAQAEETPYTVDLQVSAGCQLGIAFAPAPPYGPFQGEAHPAFAETITAPTVPGNYTCTVTAVMNPGGPVAEQTINVTVTPGEPANLELEPAAATNTVDEEHCVTATVTDEFGNPTPGLTVRFGVTGSVTTGGSATTDANGQADFCYDGPALPGEDVITAFADTNDDGEQNAGEPGDTATKTWVLPASTEGCKVTYGGHITAANGDPASFGGNAKAPEKGNQNYVDHGPATPMHVKSLNVLAVTCSADGTEARIFGTAEIDGQGAFDYRIDLKDVAEPGASDTYRIRVANGYDSGEQVLEGGNVQIH